MFKRGQVNLWIWAAGRENDLKKLKIQAEWNEKQSS
jgi:hypothetical protein